MQTNDSNLDFISYVTLPMRA